MHECCFNCTIISLKVDSISNNLVYVAMYMLIILLLFRADHHIYDNEMELHVKNIKTSSPDYETPSVSSSGKVLSTTRHKQDIKADTVKLQENPAYKATNEFS